MAGSGDRENHDRIVVSVPLDTRYLSAVRLLAASLASDLLFSVDEIDDLRLGLSEALATLIDGGADDDRAVIELEVAPRSVTAVLRRESATELPAPDQLATAILRSVTDSCTVEGDRIRLVKLARETVP